MVTCDVQIPSTENKQGGVKKHFRGIYQKPELRESLQATVNGGVAASFHPESAQQTATSAFRGTRKSADFFWLNLGKNVIFNPKLSLELIKLIVSNGIRNVTETNQEFGLPFKRQSNKTYL